MKLTTVNLETRGPRPLGQTIYGIDLDAFDLEPGKATWVRQVTDDHGIVKRYTSDQPVSVPQDELDWEPV